MSKGEFLAVHQDVPFLRIVIGSKDSQISTSDTEQSSVLDCLYCAVDKRRSRAIRIEINNVDALIGSSVIVHQRTEES